MPKFRHAAVAVALLLPVVLPSSAAAQTLSPAKPYLVEWVYRVRYGFQDEWWRNFQKYQIAELDEEQRRGYVRSYSVFRPGLHTSEDSRWDYRIVIAYNGYDGSTHEAEVERALFPDVGARKNEENRRWALTENHWDLPIYEINPHAPPQ
jgi:hypothetical protein